MPHPKNPSPASAVRASSFGHSSHAVSTLSQWLKWKIRGGVLYINVQAPSMVVDPSSIGLELTLLIITDFNSVSFVIKKQFNVI